MSLWSLKSKHVGFSSCFRGFVYVCVCGMCVCVCLCLCVCMCVCVSGWVDGDGVWVGGCGCVGVFSNCFEGMVGVLLFF